MQKEFSKAIKTETFRLGFDFCGIAPAGPFPELKEYYNKFIGEKKYTGLSYLEKYASQRLDPSLLMPDIKSVIAVLLNYFPHQIIPVEDNFVITKYAYGQDHHLVMNEKMNLLRGYLATLDPSCKSRMFIDSGPVLEKAWARRCGVGWQGKNTLLINKRAGSFFFIGIIFTNLELDHDTPGRNHCGTCTRCLDACPTGALTGPYQLEPSKCIAYHNIETKGEIPPEIAKNLNNRIFGCDICQDVCPFNRFSIPHREPRFNPAEELITLRKSDWLSLKKETFNRIFANSAIKRTGYEKIMGTITSLGARDA